MGWLDAGSWTFDLAGETASGNVAITCVQTAASPPDAGPEAQRPPEFPPANQLPVQRSFSYEGPSGGFQSSEFVIQTDDEAGTGSVVIQVGSEGAVDAATVDLTVGNGHSVPPSQEQFAVTGVAQVGSAPSADGTQSAEIKLGGTLTLDLDLGRPIPPTDRD